MDIFNIRSFLHGHSYFFRVIPARDISGLDNLSTVILLVVTAYKETELLFNVSQLVVLGKGKCR